MRVADLLAPPPVVEREAEADQGERDTDGRRGTTRVLSDVGIDQELVEAPEAGEMSEFIACDLAVQLPARLRRQRSTVKSGRARQGHAAAGTRAPRGIGVIGSDVTGVVHRMIVAVRFLDRIHPDERMRVS